MIEEPELRDLFAAEAAENLERMERGLLALERTPGERAVLESVFRQAHSLKGSAASLGLSAVESVAHHFEDVLDAARHGRQPLTPERADRLYRTLDTLRALVDEQVTGRPSGVDMRATLKALEAPLSETAAEAPLETVLAPPPEPTLGAESVLLPNAPPALEMEVVAEAAPTSVRVETVRLDRALAEMGDLVVTSARLGLRRLEAQQLLEMHETFARQLRHQDTVRPRSSAGLSSGDQLAQVSARLELLIRSLTDDQTRLEHITERLRDEIQEMRLVPLSGLFNRFSRVVRDLGRQEGKEIRLLLEGGETTADRRLLEGLSAPLTHLVRNAVDHGVERPQQRTLRGKPAEATLQLAAVRRGPILEICLRDDGAGLDLVAIRKRAVDLRLRTEEQLEQASEAELAALIFVPGFSTRTVVSDLSGRGTGLDAVRSAVEGMGGTVAVESYPDEGTSFRLRIPLTLATSQVMVCSCADRLFAIPLAFVERSLLFDRERTFAVEGRPCLEVEGVPVPVVRLERVLGLQERVDGGSICLMLSDQVQRQGFLINSLLGVMEIVVKPFYESPLVSGASILPDGRVCLVLHSTELLRRARAAHGEPKGGEQEKAESELPSVLLVEDSATIRAQAQKVLEHAGYRVTSADNGADAWKLARSRRFDGVVSDIEMPRMDGLELTRRLRALASYRDVPVVLVTSLSGEESRLAGLEAGASAFLSKSSLEDGSMLRLLERLL